MKPQHLTTLYTFWWFKASLDTSSILVVLSSSKYQRIYVSLCKYIELLAIQYCVMGRGVAHLDQTKVQYSSSRDQCASSMRLHQLSFMIPSFVGRYSHRRLWTVWSGRPYFSEFLNTSSNIVSILCYTYVSSLIEKDEKLIYNCLRSK